MVAPERQPEPIVQPTVIVRPDLSSSILHTPVVHENIVVPEPKILVEPIINRIDFDGNHILHLPNGHQ